MANSGALNQLSKVLHNDLLSYYTPTCKIADRGEVRVADQVFNNQTGKSLLSKPWYAAAFVALPVWTVLYLFNQPAIDWAWPIRAPVTFLLLTMLYPLLEETVFRGLIQGEMMHRTVCRQQFAGITLANILTSILFSLAHLLTHPPAMTALVLLPSLAFGYFRDRHEGWLLPAILLHIYYNLGYFLIFKPVI